MNRNWFLSSFAVVAFVLSALPGCDSSASTGTTVSAPPTTAPDAFGGAQNVTATEEEYKKAMNSRK